MPSELSGQKKSPNCLIRIIILGVLHGSSAEITRLRARICELFSGFTVPVEVAEEPALSECAVRLSNCEPEVHGFRRRSSMMKTSVQSSDTNASSPVPPAEPDSALPETVSFENSDLSVATTEPRRMRPVRFASGLILSTTGIGTVLLVGMQMKGIAQISGDFALGLVAVCVLFGVTLLGGGFGLMATASSGFDEREFDDLLKKGNISAMTVSAGTASIQTMSSETASTGTS